MDLDPFVPIGIDAADDALPRRLPAALPAGRQPARHAGGDRRARRATSSAPPRAAASRACGSSAAPTSRCSSTGAARSSTTARRSPRALDAATRRRCARARRCTSRQPTRCASPTTLPSARVLDAMTRDFDGSFVDFGCAQSRADPARACSRCRSRPTRRRGSAALARQLDRGAAADRGRRHDAVRDLSPGLPGHPPARRLNVRAGVPTDRST